MYVYKCELKSRFGLTPSLISKLGPPDHFGPNPYDGRMTTCLYLEGRVEDFAREHEAEIKKAQTLRERRKTLPEPKHSLA